MPSLFGQWCLISPPDRSNTRSRWVLRIVVLKWHFRVTIAVTYSRSPIADNTFHGLDRQGYPKDDFSALDQSVHILVRNIKRTESDWKRNLDVYVKYTVRYSLATQLSRRWWKGTQFHGNILRSSRCIFSEGFRLWLGSDVKMMRQDVCKEIKEGQRNERNTDTGVVSMCDQLFRPLGALGV